MVGNRDIPLCSPPEPAGACECAGPRGRSEIRSEPSLPNSRMPRPSLLSSFPMMKYYLVLELGIGTDL